MSGLEDLPIDEKIAIERGHFRFDLRSLASEPGFVKQRAIGRHLNHSLHLGKFVPQEYQGRLLPLNDIFVAVYGPGGAGLFWHAECSVIRSLSDLILLFCKTLDPPATSQQAYGAALSAAVLKAYQMGENWIIADNGAFEGVRHSWQIPAKRVQIDVEKAAQWFLNKPPFKHLVPASLVDVIAAGSMHPASDPLTPATIDGSLADYDAAMPLIKTRPRPTKREAVVGEMKRRIETGEMTFAKLRELKKKELPRLFGAAVTTCHQKTNSDRLEPP